MPENDITSYPRGPYREHYFEGLKRDNANHLNRLSVMTPALGTVSDGYERLGFGGRLSLHLTDILNIGADYTYAPRLSDQFIEAHRFGLFLEIPEKLPWGRWRLGLFSDLPSLTSWHKITNDAGMVGVNVGVDLPIFHFGNNVTFDLMFNAGLGFTTSTKRLGSSLSGGPGFNFTF